MTCSKDRWSYQRALIQTPKEAPRPMHINLPLRLGRLTGESAGTHQLTEWLREHRGFTLQGVPLCLGRLESIDIAPLLAQCKEEVAAFWTAYYAVGGEPTENQFNGVGILGDADRSCLCGKLECIFWRKRRWHHDRIELHA